MRMDSAAASSYTESYKALSKSLSKKLNNIYKRYANSIKATMRLMEDRTNCIYSFKEVCMLLINDLYSEQRDVLLPSLFSK